MTRGRDSKVTGRIGGDHGRLRAAYRAALEFLSSEPWLQLGNEDYVVLELEGDSDPLVAVVMGAAGEEFGLMVACGPRAEAQLQRMFLGGDADEGLIEGIDMLALYVDRMNRLPGYMRAEVKRAGLKAKGGTRVPYYMCKRPYHHLQQVGPRDLRRLHAAVCGLMIAQERGWLDPGADVRPHLRLVGDPLISAPEPGALDVQRVASGGTRPDGAPPADFDPLPSPALTIGHQDLTGLPVLKETWFLLLAAMPGRVVGSSEVLRTFIVFDMKSGLLLGVHAVSGPRGALQAVDYLLGLFQGRGTSSRPGAGIPERLEVSDEELLGLLAPVLEPAGVTCRYQTKIPPEVDHLLDSLREFLACPDGDEESDPLEDDSDDGLAYDPGDEAHWSGDPDELAHAEDFDPDALPAPGDLEAWKAVEHRLIRRSSGLAPVDRATVIRLTARYFGGAEARQRLMERLSDSPELPFLTSFHEWYWLDYRKNNREPTLAERMLAGQEGGPLPRADHQVLKALCDACMSLHRVVSVEPDQSVILEDVLRGGRCEVADRSLSRTAKPGIVFPGRVFPCGDFNFISGAALVIPPMIVDRALEQLRLWGLGATPAALRRGAHLFGRLWDFVQTQPLPRMQTTDGEELVLHEATFRVRSPEIVRTALRSHPDYRADPSEDVYVWFEARPGSAVDPVLLGRFQLDGDRLRFSTNSAPRWERARAWVERALPDAKLDDLQRHDVSSFERLEQLSQRMTGGPAGTGLAGTPRGPAVGPAGRGPAKTPRGLAGSPSEPQLSTEEMDAFRTFVQQRQLRWIDESIPMFGGRTPREVVRTKAGQRRVQQVLRTFAPSLGPGGALIEPPVAEMRRRLGLPPEDDDLHTTASVKSSAQASSTQASDAPPCGAMPDNRNARKRARRKQKKGRGGKKR